jgi:PAS domain S-box-containing protein
MNLDKKITILISWFLSRPKTTGILVFTLLFLVSNLILFLRYQIIKESEQREMSSILNVVHQNIEQSLKNSHISTLTLAMTIDDNGNPSNFDEIGKQLVDSNPNIDAVELVPNGVIKYVYPLKGNEPVINYNILDSEKASRWAMKAIKNRKIYYVGPLELKQGGLGIVGWFPVFKSNKFWGFCSVVIKFNTFLETSGIKTFSTDKYYFQFSKTDPETGKEEFFLPNKKNFTNKTHLTVSFPDGDWKLYLITTNNYYLIKQLIPIAILAIVLSLICGLFTTSLLKRPSELQRLVHSQALRLMKSEIKFKSIFEQAAIGIAHIDSNSGTFIEANERFCQMLGYETNEISKMDYMMITHPNDLENDFKKMRLLKRGVIREFGLEKRFFHKDGNIVWASVTITPLWSVGEKPTSHIGIIEDITDKKEAQDRIKRSEKRFKSLFNNSPIPLWEEDFSEVKKYLTELGLIDMPREEVEAYLKNNIDVIRKCLSLVKVIDVNNMCLTLHSVKDKNILKGKLSTIFDDESIPIFSKQLIAITQRQNHITGDSQIKFMDNQYKHIHFRWSVVPEYEKTLERVLVSTEDITERKNSEEVILKSQQKIESLINTIDGIVWEGDPSTFDFTFISRKVEDILGYTPEEWLETPSFWINHVHPDDKEWVIAFMSRYTYEKRQHDFEYRMIRKDGEIVWLRDIVSVVVENDKAVNLRGIMIDITKAKMAEIELNNTLHLVTEQNKRLLNLSYIVSHNLRSHTSNIQSISNLIESADTDEERDEMIQLLKSVSSVLNETMNNLNEVVTIQTNINLIIEPLNLKKYINKTLDVLREQLLKNDVIIHNDVNKDIEVKYNPAYLESILLNFISNAIRYGHADRQTVIDLKSYQEDGKTVLEISDNGIGIDLEKNGEKLFGMYKTFTNHADARGIGLFISKNQIDAMGGKIVVKSTLDEGTTFKIYFR